MNAESARNFLLSLPHVVETEQWGGLVYWVADKALGGKMFVMMNPEGEHPLSFPVGEQRFADLLEIDGIIPAPYMARIFWVTAERWNVFRTPEWEEHLRAAHAMTLDKLPPRTKKVLELPKSEYRRVLAERRKVLAVKAAIKTSSKKRA